MHSDHSDIVCIKGELFMARGMGGARYWVVGVAIDRRYSCVAIGNDGGVGGDGYGGRLVSIGNSKQQAFHVSRFIR